MLMLFSALFCFTSSTPVKCFPLSTFFIRGNKKSLCGQDGVHREGVGHRGLAIFGPKLLNTQHSVGS